MSQQDSPARVGRRLAAIVAADVAGYSRLMGLDEVGTARALREHRKVTDALVAKHGGRLVKSTGDGVLLEFPSVVDAVECAVAVQEVMAERNQGVPEDRRMLFRIGVNLGDILIEEGGDILGDGVNVAARLEGIAEPGGICISSSAYDQVRGKVTLDVTDLGEQSLKNITRPIRAFAVQPKGGTTILSSGASPLPLPDKPSIAVLPFQNMSGDPEQEYFADGIVEDIITALSRFKSLFVIARNSSFTYKGKSVDIKKVGQQLGVRYVLEGSVRKVGGKVRITGQLIDADTGAHLWADKIDGSLADVFELQDEVTLRVVGYVAPSIIEAEIERALAKPTHSQGAYDLYLRALAAHYQQTPEGLGQAISLLEAATKIDPGYSWAKAFAAYLHVLRVDLKIGGVEDVERGLRLARAALNASRDDPNTIGVAAHALGYLSPDKGPALTAMDRALQLNGNSYDLLARAGWMRIWVGDGDRAIELFSRALRISPLDPQIGFALSGLAAAYAINQDFEQTIAFARRATREMPTYVPGWAYLIVSAAYLGEREEMETAKRRILELVPDYSLARRRAGSPIVNEGVHEISERGLRMAGIPET